MKFNTLLWLLTSGLQFVVGWWYRKQAVFYLPQGWFGPLGWWLSLPFAPAGSVSVGVWQMACKRVILVGERVLKDLVGKHYAIAETRLADDRSPFCQVHLPPQRTRQREQVPPVQPRRHLTPHKRPRRSRRHLHVFVPLFMSPMGFQAEHCPRQHCRAGFP